MDPRKITFNDFNKFVHHERKHMKNCSQNFQKESHKFNEWSLKYLLPLTNKVSVLEEKKTQVNHLLEYINITLMVLEEDLIRLEQTVCEMENLWNMVSKDQLCSNDLNVISYHQIEAIYCTLTNYSAIVDYLESVTMSMNQNDKDANFNQFLDIQFDVMENIQKHINEIVSSLQCIDCLNLKISEIINSQIPRKAIK